MIDGHDPSARVCQPGDGADAARTWAWTMRTRMVAAIAGLARQHGSRLGDGCHVATGVDQALGGAVAQLAGARSASWRRRPSGSRPASRSREHEVAEQARAATDEAPSFRRRRRATAAPLSSGRNSADSSGGRLVDAARCRRRARARTNARLGRRAACEPARAKRRRAGRRASGARSELDLAGQRRTDVAREQALILLGERRVGIVDRMRKRLGRAVFMAGSSCRSWERPGASGRVRARQRRVILRQSLVCDSGSDSGPTSARRRARSCCGRDSRARQRHSRW